MLRVAFPVAAAFSLVLCVAVCALWVRSHRVWEHFQFCTDWPSQWAIALQSRQGSTRVLLYEDGQGYLSKRFMRHHTATTLVGNYGACSVDLALVEVGVGPAHRRLNAGVQPVQGAVPDLDAPPDRRIDAQESDLELQTHGSLEPQLGITLLVSVQRTTRQQQFSVAPALAI